MARLVRPATAFPLSAALARAVARKARRTARGLQRALVRAGVVLGKGAGARLTGTAGVMAAAVEGRRYADSGSAAVVRAVLDRLERLPGSRRRVALVLDRDAVAIANAVVGGICAARLVPEVHLLAVRALDVDGLDPRVSWSVCRTVERRVEVLADVPRLDMVVERGHIHQGHKSSCLTRLLPFVRDGGLYSVEDLHRVAEPGPDDSDGRSVRRLLRDLDAVSNSVRGSGARRDNPLYRLADAVAAVQLDVQRGTVTKRGTHLFKLRDAATNDHLDRTGRRWGSVLATTPGQVQLPRVRVTSHGGQAGASGRSQLTVPERFLREYRNIHASQRQVLFDDRFFLPDTFRHPQMRRLGSRPLVSLDHSTARLRRTQHGATRRLDGRYFWFDTEYPGHYGHILTEVQSRVPGWRQAVAKFPGIRPLISLDPGQQAIPGFQATLFTALGIDPATIEYIQPNEVVSVERLVAVTPGFAMPAYAAAELREVWLEVGDALAQQSQAKAELLFVSRRRKGARQCHNTDAVEDFFAAEGCKVLYPQDHSLQEQVALFRSARVIAGFSGSGMFNAMFCREPHQMLVSSSSYTANNEFLIAAVAGGTLDIFWGDADVEHPPNGWTWAAFQAPFSFDIEKHADAMRHVLHR